MSEFAQFKQVQREIWSTFAPIETFTTPPAAHLVRFANVAPGQRVLDVGCGTGVVAVTAALRGAEVTGLDLTPALLGRARENADVAQRAIRFVEGDAEALPFEDHAFDVVVSQFGHMFAPRPHVAVAEMLRVLRPGGTLAFATWPPEHFVGRMFALTGRYLPPPPPGASPVPQWGDVEVVRQRLGDAVDGLRFDRGTMYIAALSLGHYRELMSTTGPMGKILRSGAPEVPRFIADLDALVSEYWDGNTVRQEYLLTRALKR